jgi:hypothetical protein
MCFLPSAKVILDFGSAIQTIDRVGQIPQTPLEKKFTGSFPLPFFL